MNVLLRPHDLPLRGRAGEVGRARDLLSAGRGSVLLTFEGTPGTGKSRMLHETGRIAEESGLAVVHGLPGADVSAASGLVVLLDDVHFTGREDAKRLAERCGRMSRLPVLWCISRRRGWRNSPLDRTLHALTDHQERIVLGALPAQAIRALAVDLLEGEPDEALWQLLTEAGGHPEAVKVLIEGLLQENLVQRGARARLVTCAVPERFRGLVQRLLQDCSPSCRRMLWVAAVLGRRIVVEELAWMLDTTPSALLSPLHEAEAAGLVWSGGVDAVFANELFRQVISESIPLTVRSAVRQQAGQRIPECGAARVGRLAEVTSPAGAGPGRAPRAVIRSTHTQRSARPRKHPARVSALPGDAPSLPVGHGGDDRAARVKWDDLTDMQRTIARLVSDGMTNRQVADSVYLSPHTVNYHLRRIYQALSIRSRIELVRLLREQAAGNGAGAVAPDGVGADRAGDV